jgi:hypothetical protein
VCGSSFETPRKRAAAQDDGDEVTRSSCAGLTRASIHLRENFFSQKMDCRVKPGNDAGSC